jgi:hypothetical protein
MNCPRSWSPEMCNQCWPKFSSGSSGSSGSSMPSCPPGWCQPERSNSCHRQSSPRCPKSNCPRFLFSGGCFAWGFYFLI